MVSNIHEFESIFNMDPFKVLGVSEDMSKEYIKKIYKKKCLILHPDKSRKHTNLEFQILNCAYNVIKKHVEQLNKSYDSLTLERKNDTHLDSDINDILEIKKDFNNRFEDMRKDIKAPSDVGYDVNNRTTRTEYSEQDIEKPEKILLGKKFNNEKFNAIFEHLKGKNKLDSNELVKHENFYDSSLSSAEIHSHDNKVVYGTDGSGPSGFTIKSGLDYKDAYKSVQNPSGKLNAKIDYERTSVKKTTRVLTRSEIKNRLNKMNETVSVPVSKSRAEVEAEFMNNKLESLRLEKENSRKMINKYSSLISYN